MVRKKILSRAKKNNFKRKAKGRRVQSKRVSKRVSKKRTKRTKRSSNKKIRKSFKKLRDRTRLSLRDMRGGAAEPESLELKLVLKRVESVGKRLALAKLSGKYDIPIPQDLLILINNHLLNIEKELMAKEPKVNEDEYKEIDDDIRSVYIVPAIHGPREHDLEMFYSQAPRRTSPYHPTPVPKNNISINITINKGKKEIEIEKMEFPHDESKGAEKATHVLYYMINQAWAVKPDFTINVTVVTDESNIESLCRYYENMSFKKDPLHSREGSSQRLKTSVMEFLNNRIDDILIELIEIMVSKGIQNAEQLINTLEWKNELLDGRDAHETIYNLLGELEAYFDEEDYLSEILSPDDKTKMKDIFSLYLSEV